MKRRSTPFKASPQSNKLKKTCPPFKKIKGTKFAVDAFCYGDLPEVEIYFLTHFHSDHYIGLNGNFKHPVYCSKITGDLCKQVLNVKSNNIRILEDNKTTVIAGTKVTIIDANHCPGSVMIVFTLPNGQNILHCGDFRATNSMHTNPFLKNTNFDLIYLDTTYCDPKYDFPSQKESIESALSILKKKKLVMLKNGEDFSKLLIVCGTYTIGKEKFFLGIAENFKLNIWSTPEKNKILKTAINQDFNKTPSHLCGLHVLPMLNLNYDYLHRYLQKSKHFNEIIAFKPSGWEHSKDSFTQRENVAIFGIPYSEHSSFIELQNFIKFFRPKSIIPTVPGRGGNAKMQKHFSCWIGAENQKSQTKISDFFKVSNKPGSSTR
ncbi:DNA cross-link repair 1A protein-like isoform X2 [Arctopsyche grandis]|uniref:DNA cross-link repair 1A protein-like isoform X2 n=1 Tax=Arctopsyche grandis TaxID=121162 RepID=UPI00406D82DB